ncbi:MAG: hypothetical protein AAF465_03830 [Pseudomonadota bacterium]
MNAPAPFLTAILAVLLVSPTFADSGTALSDAQTEALIERAAKEAAEGDNECDNKKLLGCMGINSAQCVDLRDAVISECTMPMARQILGGEIDTDNLELQHAQCTLQLAEASFDIDARRYFRCMPEGTYEKPDIVEAWLDNR